MFQNFFDDPRIDRQKIGSNRSHTKGADDRADAYKATQQIADCHEAYINDDSRDTEFAVQFLADDNSYKVIWTGAGIWLDDDRHTIGEDDAACYKHEQTSDQRTHICKDRCQKEGVHVNDRTAADHTDDRAELHICTVNKKQYKDDQKTDSDMYATVCEKG